MIAQLVQALLHNASGYFTRYGDEVGAGQASMGHLDSRVVTGTTRETKSPRTLYLGFLRLTESVLSGGYT